MDATNHLPARSASDGGRFRRLRSGLGQVIAGALLTVLPLGCQTSTGAAIVRQTLMGPADAERDAITPVAHAVLGAPVVGRVVDLETALVLAGADNPTIGIAREAVRASQALQLQADAQLLPSLTVGGSYNWHRGPLLSVTGIVNVERQSAYVGSGAATVGASTVGFPGVRLTANITDAIYEPLATRQQVAARSLDAQATQNTVLLEVATRYLALVGAEAKLRANQQSEAEFTTLAALMANRAKAGQGRNSDAERARAALLLLQTERASLREEIDVAAADLARLLSIDPTVDLRSPGGSIPLMQFVDPAEPLERLVQTAVAVRPEVGARAAEVAELQTRLRKERLRPFMPMVSVGFSAGGFGGGGNQADTGFGHFEGRTDFDALAVWSLQNFGLGNYAVQRRLRAEVGAMSAEQIRTIDVVRREVAEAYGQVVIRRQQLDVARRRVETAQRAYQQDLTRARNLEGRPIEVLNSANLLNNARQDLIRAMIEDDQAQFALFAALGNSVR